MAKKKGRCEVKFCRNKSVIVVCGLELCEKHFDERSKDGSKWGIKKSAVAEDSLSEKIAEKEVCQ